MGDFLAFERFYWFDSQIRKNAYPNLRHLSEHFEIDRRTASRTLDFMRDRMKAPLIYWSKKRGYSYTDNSYELPRFQITQEELLSLLLARQLLSPSAGGLISEQILSFFQKLISVDSQICMSPDRLDEIFSATWIGYTPTTATVFQTIFQGLLEQRVIEFSYTTPRDGVVTNRTAEPHHLQHYMGNWIMIALCHLRNEWRTFTVSRIDKVKLKNDIFSFKPREEWESQLAGGFGLFQGKELVDVILRFNPFRTRWIKGECWHPQQRVEELTDGSLRMTFPVAAFHEVKMRILQYGADVVVEAPEKLRTEIAEEIEKMNLVYK
ncbi:transcriptional regulator [Syntrophotalea acetylenivorans]|uniref:Transcriptional regulator n=1 Tax=Syntrophotalea acetylenivorans TaxID=1842532 RepID=A0A1L3GMS4_9BACT|nr:WYL domain-containing protein [Syntrophotalea acetylenivorans]APG27195.1 transcriptional regulator [Syntrophotalea acetylenivorans]